MFMTALLTSLLSPSAHAIVPPWRGLDADMVTDDGGDLDGFDYDETYQQTAAEAACEPGELEIGSIDHEDGDCSIVSYVGLDAECRVYTRSELVCVDVIFEDIEE